MTLPVASLMKKDKKPSLVLTLSSAGLLIGGGALTYWLLTQGKPLSRDLLPGANIIPQDALFVVSVSTDPTQWQKLREFGTKETLAELDRQIVQLQERLTNNGYDFQKDISPWVSNQISIAVLAPEVSKTPSKPVATSQGIGNEQSVVMVLPIKNKEAAKNILVQSKALNGGKWLDRSYKSIAIRETQGKSGEKFSAAIINERFLVITDNPRGIEKSIDAYKNKTSLDRGAGFTENYPKIATYQPFAQFYVNVPFSAKIAAASPNRPIPAQVLSQLQNNQGLAGSISLESEGVRVKGVSWLNPNSTRVIATENNALQMQNRLPAETLMMLSGGNLKQLWADYALSAQGNPRSPMTPEQLRSGVKSLTNLDLERDFLNWMGGFSLSVIPNIPKKDSSEDFLAAFVFMVEANDRSGAEASIRQLDDVMKNQYQLQLQYTTVAGKPVVNWLGPDGTLTATHGWLDKNVAFLAVGAPVTDRILSKPNYTLADTATFQTTVARQVNPTNGQFFLDVERTAKNFPLSSFLPIQQNWLEATRSIGVTTAVSDNRSTRYDIFLTLKKQGKL